MTLKWKVINNNDYDSVKKDLLNTLLTNREVEDINALLNVSESDVHHWSKLNNINLALECLKKHIDNKSNIHIIADCDCDGYSSFAYVYNYIFKNFNVKCSFHTHKKKEHGIIIKEFKELEYFNDINLIISPDGGSFDYKAQEELLKLGKDIIVLDHHSPEEGEIFKQTKAIVVNPQLDNYPNKTLAGVGVVHKFCEALDELYQFNASKNYLDLVATGCIADSMDLRDLETRHYVLKGIEQMKKDKEKRLNNLPITGNLFIQEIIKSKEDKELKHINIDSIGWEIAPLVNGMCRFGKQDEKIDTLRALIGEQEERWYQPRRKHKEDPKPDKVLKTLQEEMVRLCTNAKSRQDNAKSKGVEKLQVRILEKELDKNKILIVDGTDTLESSTLSGLVANGLANKYKRPCIILRKKDDDIYGGSGRDYEMSPIVNFKKFISDTKCFEYCRGHNGAFGISIKYDNLFKINDVIEDMLKDIVMEDTYLVDYEIPIGRLDKNQILKVGELKDLWGNTLPKPKFAITNISMQTKDIELIGDKKNVLKFKKNDINFIRFFSNEDILNQMKMKNKNGFGKAPKTVNLTVIGEFEINEYEGVKYPQINIVDFSVKKEDEILF